MARDPDEGGAFVFDLVDDDVAGLDAPTTSDGAGAGDPDGAGLLPGEPSSDTLGRRLRALAPVAAVLAIVLGTGFAVEGVRDGARMERMRDVHGGVVDVTAPLEQAWAWAGSVGPARAADDGRWNEVAVLGDLLAFQSGDDLVALDPATGAEAWRIGLGEDPDCGPQGTAGWTETRTPRLVCLWGAGTDRVALVLGPDGAAAAERALSAADTRRYGPPRPGPDGTVLRAERVGPEPGAGANDAACAGPGECTGTVDAGRGLRLRAEDAVTGEERWVRTVPFRPTPADQCTNWYATQWDGSSNVMDLDDMLDREGFGARIMDDAVYLYGCGIESAVTSGGVLLGSAIEPGTGGVEGLRAGGYAGYTFDDEIRTTLYDAEGGVVGEIDGYALEPTTADGSEPGTLLASDGSVERVRSFALDAQLFLAQVGGAAIFQTGSGDVRALELATGAERWTWDPTEPDDDYPGDLFVSRAFTDGETVLLATETPSGGTGLVALDVLSGEVAWEQRGSDAAPGTEIPGPGTGLVAVDGNLLEVSPDGVRGLG
jgi:outer membrane protein assembly factor BamB